MPDETSYTCLDMRAIEGQGPQPLQRTETSMRHLLDENLFKPRKQFTASSRHMLEEPENLKPFHHNERLRLRKLLNPKPKYNPKLGMDRRTSIHLNVQPLEALEDHDESEEEHEEDHEEDQDHPMKPRKNVSFVDQVAIDVEPDTPPSEKKVVVRMESDSESEDDGINFSVGSPKKENSEHIKSSNPEPTAAERTLPWKQESDSPPLSSQRHSYPSLQEAMQQDIPDWVAGRHEDADNSDHSGEDNTHVPNHQSQSVHFHTDKPSNIVSKCLEEPVAHSVAHENNNTDKALDYNNSSSDVDSELPLPWKRGYQQAPMSYSPQPFQESDSYHLKSLENEPNHAEDPAQAPPELEDLPIPPPWREHDDVAPVHSTPGPDGYMQHPGSPIKTEVEQDSVHSDTGAVISPPWNTTNDNDLSAIPPPWRQLSSSSQGGIRSPSVAATLDSLRPNPSTHSFRISEAESHHSQHMHMHHLIDLPSHGSQPLLYPHYHSNHDHNNHDRHSSDSDCELGLDHVDMDEFVANWILSLEPDPDLPVNDREFDNEYIEICLVSSSGPGDNNRNCSDL